MRRGRRTSFIPEESPRAATSRSTSRTFSRSIGAAEQLRQHPIEPHDPSPRRAYRIVVDEFLERNGDALAIIVEPLERRFQRLLRLQHPFDPFLGTEQVERLDLGAQR